MPQRTYNHHRLKYARDCSAEKHGEVTNQAFKDECDINRVLDRAKSGASLSHLLKHQGSYGDFSTWDETTYENMLTDLARGRTIFNELPAEIRQEFDQNPGKFFKYVNDPANKDRLKELYPDLAKPGRQLPDVIGQETAAKLAEAVEKLAAASSDAPTDTADASNGSTQENKNKVEN